MAKLTAAQKKEKAAYQSLRNMYKEQDALEKRIARAKAKIAAQWKGKKSGFAKKHQTLRQRQQRLTSDDVDMVNLLGQRLSDQYEPQLGVRTKKGKPRLLMADLRSLGLTKAEAIKELGSTSVKDLIKSSVEFTWQPCDLGDTYRSNDEVVTHNRKKYTAVGHEQRIVIPFRVFQRFAPYLVFKGNKRTGLLTPGNTDHWKRVAYSIQTFGNSHGVDQFVGFVENYICGVSGGPEEARHAMETVIAIRNIHYFNLNHQQPQPIEKVPFGLFAAHQSHSLVDHKITPSTTWNDSFILQPKVPKQLEGFTAYCLLVPIFQVIEPMAIKRCPEIGDPERESKYKFTLQFVVDIIYNRPKTGPIFEADKTTVDKNGVVRTIKGRPIFIPPCHPDYVDVTTLADLRTTLQDATRLFEFFDVTVLVVDEHKNVLWRFDREKKRREWATRLDFVARDGHLYLCASQKESPSLIGSLHKSSGRFREPMRCSNRYIIPKPKKVNDDIVRIQATGDWRTIPDLIASTVSTTDKSIVHIFMPTREVQSRRGKRYENDLEKLFFHLRHEKQFQCEIFSIKDRSMGLLRLQRFNRDGHAMVVNVQAFSPTMETIEEEDALQGARDDLYRKMFTKPAMSSLNKYGLEWFQNALGGLIGSLCPDIITTLHGVARVWEIDTKAQHPYALSEIEMIACYSIFDYPQVYDRQKYIQDYRFAVEPYTSYFVEFHVPNHLFQDYGTCSGLELEIYKDGDYTITNYFRPSKLIPSHLFPVLARFHETTKLPEKVAKMATMPMCGSLGKQFNKSSNISFFTDADTALRHKQMYPGSIVFTHTEGDMTYYVAARELRSQLLEGFRPVYFQELGRARVSEYQKMKKISEKAILVQVKTDATLFLLPDDAGLSQAVMDRQNKGATPAAKPGVIFTDNEVLTAIKEMNKSKILIKNGKSTDSNPEQDDGVVPEEEKKEVMGFLGLRDQMVNKSLRYRDQVGKLKLSTVAVEDVLGSGAPKKNLFDRYTPNIVPSEKPVAGVYHPGALGLWEARKAGHGCPYTAAMPKFTPTITNVEVKTYTLEDEFDVERSVEFVCHLLKNCPRLFIKAMEPGAGKSGLTKAIAEHFKRVQEGFRVICLAQFWETCQQYIHVGDFKSLYSAFCVAFGGENLVFEDEDGKKKNNSRKKGVDFKAYHMVIIDEIFTADIVSLRKIVEVLFEMFPKLIVVVNGDVGQLPAVSTEMVNNIPEHLRRAYYEDIINRLFPHQILLTEVKRSRCPKHVSVYTLPEIRNCPDCQEMRDLYVGRNKAIREADDGPAAYNLMIGGMFQTIDKLSDFERLGITSAVAYQNSCCDVVNGVIHKYQTPAEHRGEKYWPGMCLIAKKSMRLAQKENIDDEEIEEGMELELELEEEEEEVEEVKPKGGKPNYVAIYTNHMYKVEKVMKNVKFPEKSKLSLSDTEDPSKTFDVKLKSKKNAYYAQIDHFDLPYCRTGHSFQGKNVDEPLCIMEGDFEYVTKEWLLVAATRNIDPTKVYIYVGNELEAQMKGARDWKLIDMARRELGFHRQSDIVKFGDDKDGKGMGNRYPSPKEYVDSLKRAVFSHQKCAHAECTNTIGFDHGYHSWDRMSGEAKHWISNCQWVCSVSCNSSKRSSKGLY